MHYDTFNQASSGVYFLGDRVDFIYGGAHCQGNIIQMPETNNFDVLIMIEVDVCNNYSVLPLEYNRVVISTSEPTLTKVSNQSWY